MESQSSNDITRKDLMKVFWRSLRILGSFNFERMQALGYLHTMMPILRKLYTKKEDIVPALKRHLLFFNTAPWVSTFIFGITIAMEEKYAKSKDFDERSIESTKISLMGPLAAIGDSFWWGTFRLLAAGIGTSLTVKGNPVGLLLYILVFNIPHYLVRYYGLFIGYNIGASFLNKAMESGIMKKITYGASIVGLMSVGAMSATMIDFTTPLEFTFGETSIKIQEILDQIFPSLLPLAVTLLVYYLLKREVKIIYIILGLLAFGVIASVIGIM